MKSFKFLHFLPCLIIFHTILLVLFFTDYFIVLGGFWLMWFAFTVSILGMVLPFFMDTPTEVKFLNLLPGLAYFTGWGSWVWLIIMDEQGPVINIWGLFGPALGVLVSIILYASMLGSHLVKRSQA